MKTQKYILVVVALTFLGHQIAVGQGFVNLGFESAIQPLVPSGAGTVPASNAIPGWTAYVGGSAVTGIYYNGITIDAAGITLYSSAYLAPIEGSYSIDLLSATVYAPAASAAIGQTGTIPGDSQSLLFVASSSALKVSFAGNVIPTSAVGTSGGYTLYGGDVSAFAGQTGELIFTCPQLNGGRQEVRLDAVSFSSVAVPEPTAFSLLGLGLLGLGWRSRHGVGTPTDKPTCPAD
jgi:hypothetical protein